MQDSIFTRIIKGEIPCHKVYEDDAVLAFLDIHPIQPGHVLVVSKKQVPFVWDLDEETYAAVMQASRKIALHLREVLGVSRVGQQIVGVDVPHAHVHLIPFNTAAEFLNKPDKTEEPDQATLSAMAQRLAF
jgi:histidine triad (HIT) family protein